MSLPKAIFFDLDDTLISFDGVSVPVWTACCAETVARYGLPVSPQALWEGVRQRKDWYWSDPERHRFGRHNNQAAQREIVSDALEAMGLRAPEAALFLADAYTVRRQEAVCLFPGVHEALSALRGRGTAMALITNGVRSEQRAKIERFDLAQYFQAILVEEEVGFGKPDPRVFQLALSQMALAPADVWMVGDNLTWDVGAPQKLGIYGIWNDWRGTGLPLGSAVVPDRIIRHIGELVE